MSGARAVRQRRRVKCIRNLSTRSGDSRIKYERLRLASAIFFNLREITRIGCVIGTAEINAYQRVAGEAIFEIGKRLKHVKENDLAHGEFGNWLESVRIDERVAQMMMKVSSELPKTSTYSDLGMNTLYHIATMPEYERTKPHELPDGTVKTPDEMTVRELREVKKALREAEYTLIAENTERRGQAEADPIKKGRIIDFMREYWDVKSHRPKGGHNVQVKTMDDIGEFVGESTKTTQRLLKLNDLIPAIQSLVSDGKLGTTAEMTLILPNCVRIVNVDVAN